MSARSAVIAVALAAALGLITGCSADEDSQASRPGPIERATSAHRGVPFHANVAITKTGYRPRKVRVLVGGTVTWVNLDPFTPHTAETPTGRYKSLPGDQDASFDSHTLSWEEPYSVTFHVPGTYEYESSFDAFTGTIDVIARNPPQP